MPPPPAITYGQTFNALMNSELTIQTRQSEVLRQPLDGLNEGTHYSLKEALPLLPAGTLRSAALQFSEVPNMTFSYKLATVNGETVPQFSFLQETPASVPYKNGTYLSSTGSPKGEPAPTNSFTANVGGIAIIVGADKAMTEGGMPSPLVAPVLGGSYALADVSSNFFFKSATEVPSPLASSIKLNLTSMGVATGVNTGWAYGLDLMGVDLGTDANAYGSLGGTLLTFAPAIESPLNPIYWPAFGRAFQSSLGMGLAGGAEGSSIFLAEGAAGGAGYGGAAMQGLGALGAVMMGGSLGGWVTDHATGMDDENDPQGRLAKMVLNRFKSEAWGGFGQSPFGSIMAGIISPVLSDGMETAEDQIVGETKAWAGSGMDVLLISALMMNSDKKGEAMDYEGFKKSLKLFYQQNSNAIYAQDGVLQTLRANGLVSGDDLGITRFVDNNGDITNPEGLRKYAADLIAERLKLRNQAIENILEKNGLIVGDDGQIATKYGTPFTQEQIDVLRTTRATLGRGVMRLTNALATLRPEAITN